MIRIGTEKVRTGCFTCKRRRVKCDEGQPECQRCIKGGRACEGYARSSTPGSGSGTPLKFVVYSNTGGISTNAVPSKQNTGANTPFSRTPSPPSILSRYPDLDHAERRALSYFQERAAWELSGALQPVFWLNGVLPVIHHEPSVKHALVAVSTMHEHFTQSGRMSPNTYSNTYNFALNHYGRAIRDVVRINESRGEHSLDCSLITCGLFSMFESLQGHYHSAFSHAVSGIKIMAELQQDPLSKLRTSGHKMYISGSDLTRFFFSFWRQILEIGDWNFQGERPVMETLEWNAPQIFHSNEEALTHVEYNTSAFFAFYEKGERLATSGNMTPEREVEMQAKHQELARALAYCEQACKAMTEARTDPSLGKTPSALLLDIHRILLTMYIVMVEHAGDMDAFEQYLPSMQQVLDLVEEFLVVTDSSDRGDPFAGSRKNSPSRSISPEARALSLDRTLVPTFSMSLGVVPCLFVIATRVTHLPVRDRALHLLRICNRKEGFWDSQLSACLAARTIEIKANAVEQFRAATPSGLNGRELRESDIKMKLENIQYYPDNECVLHYSLMWELTDENGGSDGELGIAVGAPGEPLIRKRDFSERLAWGDQPAAVGTDDPFTSMMRNGLISEEIRKPLHIWEKQGMVR